MPRFLIVAALLLATGCAAAPAHTGSGDVAAPVTAPPPVVLPDGRCTAAQFGAASFDLVRRDGESVTARLVLTRAGGGSCTLSGHGDLQLRLANGAPLPTHVTTTGRAARFVVFAGGRVRQDYEFRVRPDDDDPVCSHAAGGDVVVTEDAGEVTASLAPFPQEVCWRPEVTAGPFRPL